MGSTWRRWPTGFPRGEVRELRNGVFTAALLRGPAGAADPLPADGVIRIQEPAFLARRCGG